MKLIYGIVGESTQTIVQSGNYSPNENEVRMLSERPEIDMIANEVGEWVRKELTLAELKAIKLDELQKETADKITGGFICIDLNAKFDSDIDTQITMQGIALNASTERFLSEYPLGCPCRGYKEDSSIKEVFYLTPEQVLHFCADLSAHIGTCKQEGWERQQKIIEATTTEEILSLYPKLEESIPLDTEETLNEDVSEYGFIEEDKAKNLEELNVNIENV